MNAFDDTRLQDLVADGAGAKVQDLRALEELRIRQQKQERAEKRADQADAELETAQLYKLELADIWEQKGALREIDQRYRETVYDYEAGREILVKPDLEHQKRRMEEALWDLAREAYNDLSNDYTEENS